MLLFYYKIKKNNKNWGHTLSLPVHSPPSLGQATRYRLLSLTPTVVATVVVTMGSFVTVAVTAIATIAVAPMAVAVVIVAAVEVGTAAVTVTIVPTAAVAIAAVEELAMAIVSLGNEDIRLNVIQIKSTIVLYWTSFLH